MLTPLPSPLPPSLPSLMQETVNQHCSLDKNTADSKQEESQVFDQSLTTKVSMHTRGTSSLSMSPYLTDFLR